MFQIDFASRVPIYEQLKTSVIQLALSGVLKPDNQLPPVRALALQLGINPNTVAKAYKMLEAEGYTYSVAGKGSFISEKLSGQDHKQQITRRLGELIKSARSSGITEAQMHEMVIQLYSDNKGGIGND